MTTRAIDPRPTGGNAVFRLIKRAPWIAIGAAGAWFFDPNCGPERRAQAKRKADEVLGAVRTTAAPISADDEIEDPVHETARARSRSN